ncbi:DUF1465 family protein [Novosphingobium guangzhouense]|uniref:AraC family transcriptional regulator n=1 Tax=Novosphingobium guangzhouense TaxID=1850347 RepID=A0A2K2FV20_9SPHN|nr:DUF1465 family protein [Novosphingobium guangzhouense]PNU02623.1 AraC family transcriptional regulator [Novosphingobium guangzhouense]
MPKPPTISSFIVEALYCDALVLSDEVRATFAPSRRLERGRIDENPGRVALYAEGLRTTTRMMHAISWLSNHRAYFRGDISALDLSRHGRLAPSMRRSDPALLPLLEPEAARLVESTRGFYDRLLRLDQSWRLTKPAAFGVIEGLRERIESERATGT